MSVTMNIPVDDFLVEIGKLHLQNASLQKQLHGANRRIAELTAETARLAKQVQMQMAGKPGNPEDNLRVLPSPEEVGTDVAEAIHANETNKPA